MSQKPRRLPACPICGRPADPQYKPFCTPRCADVDLNRWLGGVYRVEVDDPEAEIEDGFDGEPERLH
ncbi:DNA gyrase inhibitor YacG [Skermanella stibiiresistens]|nr:DNA gyrase inhibitor YacG [Skermanella stibiiresistens]